MLFSDTYRIIATEGEASLRERGSRFLSYAYPVATDAEIRQHLQTLKSKYPDATHHCYAWVLNPDKSAERANDDGEPSYSAGKPILRAIQAMNLTNTLVVVVRYFGGTQLGIPGLIDAYGRAAAMALESCQISEKYLEEEFELQTDFSHEQEIHRLISAFKARVIGNSYTESVTYHLAVRKNTAREFEKKARDNYLIAVKTLI